METVEEVLSELRTKASANIQKTLSRHVSEIEVLGVKIGDMKPMARKLKGKQELALELFDTKIYDAMYLAGLVADGSLMTKKQLEHWVKNSRTDGIAQYTVAWVTCESDHARSLALKWMKSRDARIALCGWATYSGIVATTDDDKLDMHEIKQLLENVLEKIDSAKNMVKYSMNQFVISVGSYVKPLLKVAKATAKKLGDVDVDMGDTCCTVPNASDYIQKVETAGRVGKKRKTIKC